VDILRIKQEFARACQAFAVVELHPTGDGGVYVKAALQTTAARMYIIEVYFNNYPAEVPQVYVTKPSLLAGVPHQYNKGNLCLLHPSMWNPGRHDLTFILARTAKWLNKYEVWREHRNWPGAGLSH
jgi:hypothetical protein